MSPPSHISPFLRPNSNIALDQFWGAGQNRAGGRLESPFSRHPSASISAECLSAGMVFTPETALPASTLQIFKGRKQVQDQHRRVSQQRRVDELNRIVWAVDA